MIKGIKYMAMVVLTGLLFACEPDKVTEGISDITYFPIITLKGEQWNEIAVGGTWADPGVIAKEGDTEIQAKASGTVDVSKPGVYTIQYDAVNKDGYSSTEYRYVGVIAPAVKGVDISGAYKRDAGAFGVSNVSRVSGNLFYADNVGGVAVTDPSLGVYFYYYDKGKLGVPYQRTPGNAFEAINATIVEGVKYSWSVINGGYGNAVRTFVKQ